MSLPPAAALGLPSKSCLWHPLSIAHANKPMLSLTDIYINIFIMNEYYILCFSLSLSAYISLPHYFLSASPALLLLSSFRHPSHFTWITCPTSIINAYPRVLRLAVPSPPESPPLRLAPPSPPPPSLPSSSSFLRIRLILPSATYRPPSVLCRFCPFRYLLPTDSQHFLFYCNLLFTSSLSLCLPHLRIPSPSLALLSTYEYILPLQLKCQVFLYILFAF